MIMIIININIITNLLYNICFEDELFYILNQKDVKRIVGVKFMLYIILTEFLPKKNEQLSEVFRSGEVILLVNII